MRIVADQPAQRTFARDLLSKHVRRQQSSDARYLDQRFARLAVVAEEQRNPRHPFVADRTHFGGASRAHDGHHRTDAAVRKTYLLDGLITLVEAGLERQRRLLEVRRERSSSLGGSAERIRFC